MAVRLFNASLMKRSLFAVLLATGMLPAHAFASSAKACSASSLARESVQRPDPEVGTFATVDPGYIDLMRTWSDSWKDNIRNRLTGRKSPLDTSTEFSIERFLQAREFRSWWEVQSRMQPFLQEKRGAAPAKIKIINDPHLALKTKLLAIREAKYTIDVAYYIVRGDETGLAIMNELKEALKRGVSVRFLVDSAGTLGMTPHSPLRALIAYAKENAGYALDLNGQPTARKAEVEIVSFNAMSTIAANPLRAAFRGIYNLVGKMTGAEPMAPLEFSANRRSHDKILLIDGAFEERAIVFIGGRNIANEYYGVPAVNDHTYVDFEVVARGFKSDDSTNVPSLGAQVSEYFDHIYYHLGNTEVLRSVLGVVWGYSKSLEKMEDASKTIDKMFEFDRADLDVVRRDLLEEGYSENQADIVYTFNNIFREQASRSFELREHQLAVKNAKSLMPKLEQLIVKEDQEVVLVSPYIWMSVKQLNLIKAWLLKDPKRKLTILTNSIMTSDNIMAQTLVDHVLGPSLMFDPGIVGKDGKVVRRSVADQVEIYQYGHLDSTDLGGKTPYGKLHAKGIILKGSGVSIFTTSNNDPRSLLLNSEGAIVIYDNKMAPADKANSDQLISRQFTADVDKLIAQSHLWGGEEFNQIRQHPQLPAIKRKAAAGTSRLYWILTKLNLWWLI